MSTEPMPDDAERLLEQACAWLSRLHSGEFPVSARQELNAWRAADSAHEQAWQRAEALWAGLGQLRGRRIIPGAQPLPGEGSLQAKIQPSPPGRGQSEGMQTNALTHFDSLAPTLSVIDPDITLSSISMQSSREESELLRQSPGQGGRQAQAADVLAASSVAILDSRLRGNDSLRDFKDSVDNRTHRRRRGRSLTLAVACCALLATTLSVLYPPAFWRADYSTGKGEQRSVTLADGSRVMLNTATALAIHFDASTRRVELLAGEAFFDVAKNPQRPFVVTAAGSEVRAVGTAFAVKRQPEQTEVELVEGIVEIQDAGRKHQERLTAGQSASIGANSIALKNAGQPDGMALWRAGYLQFDGLPLSDAIAQINQYRPGRVVLLDTALADKRISGLFRLDALDQAIASLKAAIPALQIVSITPYLVVLR
ncbi:FecR family protein [Methylomonas sp. MED-D]|uniref:FecR family protein n=1 Tax=unclassified Methylomonas TaxID=2608980 RepID=UPI0028A50960|nr:FecR family protein [Methylomonas sp. MV1]MDT4331658.1 FecR family protein [Methylomonas sp. MV1]